MLERGTKLTAVECIPAVRKKELKDVFFFAMKGPDDLLVPPSTICAPFSEQYMIDEDRKRYRGIRSP